MRKDLVSTLSFRESASPEETLTETGQRDGSVRPEPSIRGGHWTLD